MWYETHLDWRKNKRHQPSGYMYNSVREYMHHKEVHVFTQENRCSNPHLQLLPDFYIYLLHHRKNFGTEWNGRFHVPHSQRCFFIAIIVELRLTHKQVSPSREGIERLLECNWEKEYWICFLVFLSRVNRIISNFSSRSTLGEPLISSPRMPASQSSIVWGHAKFVHKQMRRVWLGSEPTNQR